MWDIYEKGKRKDNGRDDFGGTSMALPRCYESHPVLKVGKGRLYGGSASHPMVKDADVYVSLQSGSTSGRASDPWDTAKKVVEVYYAIRDMDAPPNVARFKKLVTWIGNQLHDGKTVHVGCIGGHGRTGTVLSAVVAEVLDKKDAIQYVRKHYCEKAVESKDQVKFLMKHYGVSQAKPTKTYEPKAGGLVEWHSGDGRSFEATQKSLLKPVDGWPEPKLDKVKVLPVEGASAKTKLFAPVMSARSLWRGKRKKAVN